MEDKVKEFDVEIEYNGEVIYVFDDWCRALPIAASDFFQLVSEETIPRESERGKPCLRVVIPPLHSEPEIHEIIEALTIRNYAHGPHFEPDPLPAYAIEIRSFICSDIKFTPRDRFKGAEELIKNAPPHAANLFQINSPYHEYAIGCVLRSNLPEKILNIILGCWRPMVLRCHLDVLGSLEQEGIDIVLAKNPEYIGQVLGSTTLNPEPSWYAQHDRLHLLIRNMLVIPFKLKVIAFRDHPEAVREFLALQMIQLNRQNFTELLLALCQSGADVPPDQLIRRIVAAISEGKLKKGHPLVGFLKKVLPQIRSTFDLVWPKCPEKCFAKNVDMCLHSAASGFLGGPDPYMAGLLLKDGDLCKLISAAYPINQLAKGALLWQEVAKKHCKTPKTTNPNVLALLEAIINRNMTKNGIGLPDQNRNKPALYWILQMIFHSPTVEAIQVCRRTLPPPMLLEFLGQLHLDNDAAWGELTAPELNVMKLDSDCSNVPWGKLTDERFRDMVLRDFNHPCDAFIFELCSRINSGVINTRGLCDRAMHMLMRGWGKPTIGEACLDGMEGLVKCMRTCSISGKREREDEDESDEAEKRQRLLDEEESISEVSDDDE